MLIDLLLDLLSVQCVCLFTQTQVLSSLPTTLAKIDINLANLGKFVATILSSLVFPLQDDRIFLAYQACDFFIVFGRALSPKIVVRSCVACLFSFLTHNSRGPEVFVGRVRGLAHCLTLVEGSKLQAFATDREYKFVLMNHLISILGLLLAEGQLA